MSSIVNVVLCLALACLCCSPLPGAAYSQPGRHSNEMACYHQVAPCQMHVSEYVGAMQGMMHGGGQGSVEQFERIMNSKTLRQHCSTFMSAMNCVMDAIDSSACEGVFTGMHRHIMDKAAGLVSYICVEKIDDISEHEEDCFKPLRHQAGSEDVCLDSMQNMMFTCDTSTAYECMARQMDEVPGCDYEAKSLISGVLDKIVELMPGCGERQHMTQLKTMLNRMLL